MHTLDVGEDCDVCSTQISITESQFNLESKQNQKDSSFSEGQHAPHFWVHVWDTQWQSDAMNTIQCFSVITALICCRSMVYLKVTNRSNMLYKMCKGSSNRRTYAVPSNNAHVTGTRSSQVTDNTQNQKWLYKCLFTTGTQDCRHRAVV